MEKIPKTIDIEQALKAGKSKLLKSLPKFVIAAIAKLIYEEEMNKSIHRNRELQGLEFVDAILDEWNVDRIVKGQENVPKSGRFVFVANHPVGGIDALSFLSALRLFYHEVISPANQLFQYIPNLHPVLLEINVFGINTKETAEKLNLLFQSDIPVMIFPSGEVSRRKRGVIADPAWQKSFVTKSVQFKRDIIPVHISGRNSNLFYFVANLRKVLGIKMYIETALLPHEMMKQRNSQITLRIGKPIPWQRLTTEKSQNEWAQYIRDEVYKIGAS